MDPRKFALYGGILMLAVGILALAFPGPIETLPTLLVETSYGLFLGLFAMNIFNKVALIVLGLAGIWAASSKFTDLPRSIMYSRLVFVATGVLAVLGLFQQTNTLYGYWPLFGADMALHAVVAVVGAYFGYALSSKVPKVTRTNEDFRRSVQGTR